MPSEREGRVEYRAGDVIAGKYRLDVVLGRGGMASVWMACNLALNADVAIKLVRRDVASEEAAHRLLNEARATAQIDHPSIVRVHDFGETEAGDPFIVMEVLKGQSLGELSRARGALEPERAVQLLLPILGALAVVHAKGVVHRDLKPDNIILVVNDAGETIPKLVDFGIARVPDMNDSLDSQPLPVVARNRARELTQVGSIVGSPDYMAPEQARGRRDVDERADVWAICVVLYQLVCGKLPFDGPTTEDVLLNVLGSPPRPLLDHDVIESKLWSIVEKGLAKAPEDRWPHARALGAELARWLVDRGVASDLEGRPLAKTWLGTAEHRLPTEVEERTNASFSLASTAPRSRRPLLAVGLAVLLIAAGAAAFWRTRSEVVPLEPAPAAREVPLASQPAAEPVTSTASVAQFGHGGHIERAGRIVVAATDRTAAASHLASKGQPTAHSSGGRRSAHSRQGELLMSIARRVLLATLFSAAVLGVTVTQTAAAEPAPESPEDVAAARKLFEEGIAASKQGAWEEALEKLTRALALKRAPIVLYSLAVAEKHSGKLAGALEHFRQFLALPVEPGTESFVEPAEKAVAELEPRVPRATIVVEPEAVDVKVTIDGRDVPVAALGEPRLLDPGDHVIIAEAPGYERAERALSLGEGDTARVTLTMTPAADGREPDRPAPFKDETEDGAPVVPITLIVVGSVVFAAGAVVGVIGIVKAKEAPSSEGDEADTARIMTIAGDVTGGVGVVTAAVGLVLLILELGANDSASALRLWREGETAGVALDF